MTRDHRLFLAEILESITVIYDYTDGLDVDDFLDDRLVQDAVIRRMEIIGEAVKNIPMDLRARSADTPWAAIAGFRDILIHGYFRVSLDRVWLAVQQDLPLLKIEVERLLGAGP